MAAAQGERAQHRRDFRPAQSALLGSAAHRIVRTACARSTAFRATEYRRNLDEFVEILEMERFPPHAGAPAFARAAHARRLRGARSCTARRSSTSTSRRSASTSSRRRRFASSSRASTPSAARRSCLTTHDLADVERLCRRIVLIDRGTLIYDGDIERIKSEYGRFRTLVVQFCEPVAKPHSTARSSHGRGRHRALSFRPQRCSAPICSCAKRANVIASKTSAWRSRISSRSSAASTSRDTAAGRRRTRHDRFQRDETPKIHSSAYVAPTATISGDVTIGAECAVLHGAVVTSEGAPVTIGARCVVMENAVLKASGGTALQFPLSLGDRCIVGPHAYVVGATIGDGCFVAAGAKIFNGATLETGSGVALGAIVHVKARLKAGASVPMLHIAYGDPATIYAAREGRRDPRQDRFLRRRLQPRIRRRRARARRRRRMRSSCARRTRRTRRSNEHRSVKTAASPHAARSRRRRRRRKWTRSSTS